MKLHTERVISAGLGAVAAMILVVIPLGIHHDYTRDCQPLPAPPPNSYEVIDGVTVLTYEGERYYTTDPDRVWWHDQDGTSLKGGMESKLDREYWRLRWRARIAELEAETTTPDPAPCLCCVPARPLDEH